MDTISDIPNLCRPVAGWSRAWTIPTEARGPRRLVQARVEAACPAGTDAQVRRLPVAMTIIDRASGLAGATLQGVAQ